MPLRLGLRPIVPGVGRQLSQLAPPRYARRQLGQFGPSRIVFGHRPPYGLGQAVQVGHIAGAAATEDLIEPMVGNFRIAEG